MSLRYLTGTQQNRHEMERFNELLLDVWREACRHIEIAEATDLITPLLLRQLPLDQLLLRIVELDRGTVETVAATAADKHRPATRLRTEVNVQAIDRLLHWCRHGEIVRDKAEAIAQRLPGLIPEGTAGEVLAGPLHTSDGPPGALVAIAFSPHSFKLEHEALLKVLLEPFTVAMENDRRLRELMALREKYEAENRSLLTKLGRHDLNDSIVGADSGLQSVMSRVALVSRADVPALILGETGSGKEVVARAIHKQSRRASGPFLRVNCGAIAPELVDSELFGHERGSFTGATALRKGWFERADQGTLFLDECGELPPAAQVRLLRILQDGTFERVGGERQMHVDVRVVAATHRNLQAMVAEGTFREDLWYRLAVFPIELPPLRDRLEDIPEMAAHFALRAAKRFGLPSCAPNSSDVSLLAGYNWPGNVRELAAVIERAAILGDGKRLDVATALGVAAPQNESRPVVGAHVQSFATPGIDQSPTWEMLKRNAPPAQGNLPQSSQILNPSTAPLHKPLHAEFAPLEAAMREHIESALRRTAGRVEGPRGAAKILGINPHTLRARMRKLKIDWSQFRMDDGPPSSS